MASFNTLRFCLLVAIFAGVSMAQQEISASEDAAESRAYPAPKKPGKYLNKNKKPSAVIAPGYRPVPSAYGPPVPTPAAYQAPAYPTPAAYQQAPAYPSPAAYQQAPAYPSQPADAYPPPAAAYRPNPTPAYKKPAAPAYPSPAPAYPSPAQQYPLESENKPYSSYKPVEGRVKMQAYRGPNKDYDKEDSFAPWGYFINQPADS